MTVFYHNLLKTYMLTPLLRYLSVLAGLLFFSISIWGKSSSQPPLITEVQIINGDSTYRYLYLYGNSSQKTLETKYVKVNEEWKRRQQTEWIYSNGLCTNQYIRVWDNYTWSLSHQIDFTYTNNLPETETHYIYGGGTYVPSQKHSYRYSNNKVVTESDSVWVGQNWVIASGTDYKYNTAFEHLDTIYFTKYNNGVLDSISRVIFSYNASSLLFQQTYSEKQDTSWINSLQTTTYYVPNSTKKNYQTEKIWNKDLKKWVYSQNIIYTYTTLGDIQSETYQIWNNQFWINDIKYEYNYDTSGALTKKITYLPIYDDFRPASSINYSDFQYEKASLIEANYEFWGGETGSLINTFIPFQFNDESAIQYGSQVKISYIPVNDTGVATLTDSIKKGFIDIYPNPSSGMFYFDIQKYNATSWTVYNIAGKVVLSKNISEKTGVIDMTAFQPGIYLLKVDTQYGILSQKLIKK